MMAGYKLSKYAVRHLAEIVEYTDRTFGSLQTDAYVAGLEQSFSTVAAFPAMGVSASNLRRGWRRHRYKMHYIFYSEQGGIVLIEAIAHTRRVITDDLLED